MGGAKTEDETLKQAKLQAPRAKSNGIKPLHMEQTELSTCWHIYTMTGEADSSQNYWPVSKLSDNLDG